ncbi:Hypothetical protein A7982_05906 [Minicystis rosea]|nr:Hypothetical protein A7982_05906 [Minicystis rosea]
MYDRSMRLSRRARYGLVALGLAAAWALVILLIDAHTVRDVVSALLIISERPFGELEEHAALGFIFHSAELGLLALLGATLAAPLGMLARARARHRLRVTGTDALAPLHHALETRPLRPPATSCCRRAGAT